MTALLTATESAITEEMYQRIVGRSDDDDAINVIDEAAGRYVFGLVVAARDRIERTGWTQHDYADLLEIGSTVKTCKVCARGALRFEANRSYGFSYEEDVISILMARFAGRSSLALWNDQPGRTRHEVVDLFERFALHVADVTDPTGRWQLTGEHPDGFAWKIEGDGGSWGWESHWSPVSDWVAFPGSDLWADDGHDSALEAHERMIDVTKTLLTLGEPE